MKRVVSPAVLAVALSIGGVGLAARPQPPVKLFPSTMAETDTVKVTLVTVPPTPHVFVYWGKRKLGAIEPKAPLVLQRPRDSGPMDLILQAQGMVPVQTRAFTFSDTKLSVKLTPLDQKSTLLGYRQAPPPDEDAGVAAPEAGAAPPPAPDGGAQGQ